MNKFILFSRHRHTRPAESHLILNLKNPNPTLVIGVPSWKRVRTQNRQKSEKSHNQKQPKQQHPDPH